MKSHWEETLRVHTYDVDSNDRLKISSIFNFMQDVASAHAENLNVGWDALQREGLLWVLSWMKIEFENYPGFEDNIKIKTWPKGRHKLYALRDFILYNENDEVFGRAASAWLLINSQTKRVTDLNKFLTDIPYQPNEHAINELPQKIASLNSNGTIFNKHVDYTDIDINEHVNNAKYIEYIQNCYTENFHKRNQVKSLKVSFVSETKYDDRIEIHKNVNDDRQHYLEALNTETGKIIFQALVEWNQLPE